MIHFKMRRNRNTSKQAGYMLLVLMLAVAVLTITMLQVAQNYRRSILRDREVEMIHRGVQYARAVRRFYKKNGRYPTTIEELEKTNEIRYLRKRYKDPMSPDGEWKPVHITDVKLTSTAGLVPSGAPGTGGSGTASAFGQTGAGIFATNATGSALGQASNTGSSAFGSAASGQTNPATSATTGTATDNSASANSTGTATGSTDSSNTGASTGTSTGMTGPASSGSNPNAVLGGGPILGVVSKMKSEGIHAFGDKKKYNEWFFIYDPSQDTGTALITGPYNPNMTLGAGTTTTPNATTPGAATTGTTGATGASAFGTNNAAPSTPAPTTTPTAPQ